MEQQYLFGWQVERQKTMRNEWWTGKGTFRNEETDRQTDREILDRIKSQRERERQRLTQTGKCSGRHFERHIWAGQEVEKH
jgi:hypothetical protein